MISEGPAARRYGIGLAKPWPFPIRPWLKKGYLVKAQTIGEIARKIGVDSQSLQSTIDEFNIHAAIGEDPRFGRGGDDYSRYYGDDTNSVNPSVGPIRTPPFYAVEIRLSDLSTLAGLRTDHEARVLDADGSPIRRLYAVGLDSNSFMRGGYPGGGSSIGPAMTFGFIAANVLARTDIRGT
jgi:predicted oxidoreductase